MNPAHSSYQYHQLRSWYREIDVDSIREVELIEQLKAFEITFQALKKIFFRRMRREGKLICVYCQRDLKIYKGLKGKLPDDMVTIEHFTPIKDGGLKYNEVNFLCACNKCNNNRGSLPAFKISETKYIW